MRPKLWHAFALMAFVLPGCDGVNKPPTQSSIPFSIQSLDMDRRVVEVDYAGRRHVFLESHGQALAKIGDYPIAKEK